MKNKTIYLRDYQPYPFAVLKMHLTFELYEDYALVHNQMHLQRVHRGDLQLDGQDLALLSIQLNGEALSALQVHDHGLIISHCPDELILNITTRIKPQDNTQLSGLYRSKNLFCTQCEAEGFRRITYFPDRPDVLTIYTTKIIADKKAYPVLLSNGNPVAAGEEANGRHWIEWHDPFKKPSYLFALVAGQLNCVQDQFVTCSGKTVDLRIYVEDGYTDQCAHAMASLQKAMRWDEEHYEREYDLDIFMIVAVSDFNMGAMENKGLNIFNAKYILARPDTATDQDYANIESVVAHEYFHNWTGNRITCRDWFQLSLKEGLTVFRDQEFSRDMNSRDVNRIADVSELRTIQFPEDAGCMAHPVQPESYQEINNFYTATIYNKGAEVIRMQQTLLGTAGFRRGMDLYFQRHDGQAVTIDDFVAAMADANGVDLTQFKRWYQQAGTPVVTIASTYAHQQLTLTVSQTCRPTTECTDKKPFHIPLQIALWSAEGQLLPIEQSLLELRESTQTFHFTVSQRPVLSVLRDFSAPIQVQQTMSHTDWLCLLRYETNGFAKWNAAQQLAMQCIIGYYQTPQDKWSLPPELLESFRHVLQDERLDLALRAELLTPPTFEEVILQLPKVDVARVEASRDFYRQALGRGLQPEAHAIYQTHWQAEDHTMQAKAFARRKLRNLCLWLLMQGDAMQYLPLCQQQYAQAHTMTDAIVSLTRLINAEDESIAKHALADFYQRWQHNDLVVEKWLTVQASCERPGTLAHIRTLLSHRAFNWKNPNKVRALIGAFTQLNPRHFHALDGSGYAFLTVMLEKLDPINPQISARLATPFTRWQQFDEPRQQLMKQQLTQLAVLPLSRDLREMVEKSLGG